VFSVSEPQGMPDSLLRQKLSEAVCCLPCSDTILITKPSTNTAILVGTFADTTMNEICDGWSVLAPRFSAL
jgi:hypothetical protein